MQVNIGYTVSQRDALVWSNGDIILNLDSGEFEKRTSDSWSVLSSSTPTITAISTNSSVSYSSIYQVDCTSGNITLTLPSAIGSAGKELSILKTDSTGNTITVITTGGQTINGDVSLIVRHQNTFITIISNGSNFILS